MPGRTPTTTDLGRRKPCLVQLCDASGRTPLRQLRHQVPLQRSWRALWVALAAALLLGTRHWVARPGANASRLFVPPGLLSTGAQLRPGGASQWAAAVSQEPVSTSGPATTANLAKNIIGAGVLALPASVATLVSDGQSVGVDPSTSVAGVVLLFLVFCILNAFGFYLIGEVCARTGARSYQAAWSSTMGKDLAWIPSLSSLICCLTGAVASASVIGDSATDLAAAATGISLSVLGQNALLVGLAGGVLLPLCLLPSLAPLAFASLLGLVGVSLLAAVMVVRCLDGSYLPGGELNTVATWQPQLFQGAGADPGALILQGSIGFTGLLGDCLIFMAVLSNAFSAHYNAPAIYEELQDPEAGGAWDRKLAIFRDVSCAAFGFSGALFLVVALAGVGTFGAAVQPFVLDNYAGVDHLAFLARAGLCLCVLFEFPLLERCFRATTVELLGLPSSLAKSPAVTAASVMLITGLACVPGLGIDKVSAFGGALGASLLIYVAPALMVLKLREKEADLGSLVVAAAWPLEAFLLRGVAAFGTMLGGLGVAEAAGLGPH